MPIPKLSTDISHQLATMVKYWRAHTVLTAESEQTKIMPHLNLDDTKHHEDTKEGVNNITGVINNQMIHPFKYEEQEMVNIWTGHKAKPVDLVRARGIGMGTVPVAARETGNEKVSTQNWSHLQKSSCFVNLLFPTSTVLRFVYLEPYQ